MVTQRCSLLYLTWCIWKLLIMPKIINVENYLPHSQVAFAKKEHWNSESCSCRKPKWNFGDNKLRPFYFSDIPIRNALAIFLQMCTFCLCHWLTAKSQIELWCNVSCKLPRVNVKHNLSGRYHLWGAWDQGNCQVVWF